MQDVVWGAAYEVSDDLLAAGSALNVREKTYQERREETVHYNNGQTLQALVFLGTNQEHLRLGPAPLQDMARQIADAQGPSGPNYQYLLNLAKFMKTEVPHYKDDHLEQLAELVDKLIGEKETQTS